MRVFKFILLAIYASLVLYIVFFARRRHNIVWSEEYLNLIPVKKIVQNYYSPDVKRWDFYSNLIGNILLFTPFPVFMLELFIISNKNLIIIGFVLSLLIELIQYVKHIGVADIDDVWLNTFGVVLGIYSWISIRKMYVRFR